MENTINIDIKDDYQLSGNITSFEAYMFITTPKFISQHELQNEEMFIANGNTFSCQSMKNLEDRKNCLTYFNKCLQENTGSLLSSKVGCCLIDFEADNIDNNDNNFLKFI